uniref:Beta-defensin n=1 Tax=Lynx canadensis TaxID=61383 RepID=A0A667FXF5_LYNCA
MKIPVLLILFFLLPIATRVKCPVKDTYSCFVKRGKCRQECHDFEKPVGFCRKLNAKCCM